MAFWNTRTWSQVRLFPRIRLTPWSCYLLKAIGIPFCFAGYIGSIGLLETIQKIVTTLRQLNPELVYGRGSAYAVFLPDATYGLIIVAASLC